MKKYKKEINWDIVELCIKSGCSQTQIADSLFIDRDTLRTRIKEKYGLEYSSFSAALRSEGLNLLKVKQYQKAMAGYWPALQWLGKVDLGQKEPEVEAQLAANQASIDQTHLIMQLQHEIETLKNAYKPKTEPELLRSDTPV